LQAAKKVDRPEEGSGCSPADSPAPGDTNQQRTGFTAKNTRPGNLLHNYGISPFFMGKFTISMVIFNSYFDITRG
jgi:hypothetical protein